MNLSDAAQSSAWRSGSPGRAETATADDEGAQAAREIALRERVDFLSRPGAYPHPVSTVERRETHMSWIFLAGERVYKLKKPVRFAYLDFSTLARREAACRAELVLNRRLAPDVYRGVVPLVRTPQGLALGGDGKIIDWLVVMRRLDDDGTLEHALATRRLEPWQIDRLAATLVAFYRRAEPVLVAPEVHLAEWASSLAFNRRILLDPRFGLPAGAVHRIDRAQRRFLAIRAKSIAARVRHRHIVDGHGDLRPEHIWLGDPVVIIDCLEFNRRLRAVDPLDEIAFLCVECERLGDAEAGIAILRRVMHALPDGLSDELFAFYRCHRATLRARLAVAHLLEPNPRTPEKWRPLARTYLRIAANDARRLERVLRPPAAR